MPLLFLKTAPLSGGVLRESNPVFLLAQREGFGMAVPKDVHDRQTRAARNQSLFREINERIKDVNDSFSAVTETGEWICECANDTCVERIEMSVNEYEAVRADGARFFVAPGDEHVWPEAEKVTDRNDRYWIVEKFGQAAALAKRADPRSDNSLPLRA